MSLIVRRACHGLGVIQPIDILAADLSRFTPQQPPFQIVGGFNPPMHEAEIIDQMEADAEKGAVFDWIGHSMGAALGFYLPKRFPKWKFRLIVTVDPMAWASNIDCQEWQAGAPKAGQWQAIGNFDRWINIHTQAAPNNLGGGVMITKDARCKDYLFAQADHIGIIADAQVRKIIFDAVKAAGT